MKNDILWPKKGDNPFKKVGGFGSPTWCNLDFIRSFKINDSWYAEAFKNSADKIIESIEIADERRHPDDYFMPIAFLYRHCLELKMKHLISLSINLNLIQNDEKLENILQEHSLYPLWNVTKEGLVKFWPNGPIEVLNAVEGVIREFHNIDKSGQSLRYTENKNGDNNSRKYPDTVELKHLKDVFESTFNLLDGCQMGYDDAIQTRDEMRYDMRGYY